MQLDEIYRSILSKEEYIQIETKFAPMTFNISEFKEREYEANLFKNKLKNAWNQKDCASSQDIFYFLLVSGSGIGKSRFGSEILSLIQPNSEIFILDN